MKMYSGQTSKLQGKIVNFSGKGSKTLYSGKSKFKIN